MTILSKLDFCFGVVLLRMVYDEGKEEESPTLSDSYQHLDIFMAFSYDMNGFVNLSALVSNKFCLLYVTTAIDMS